MHFSIVLPLFLYLILNSLFFHLSPFCGLSDLPPRIVVWHERTDVEFAPLSDAAIRAYIATGEPMDKAGGYGLQVPHLLVPAPTQTHSPQAPPSSTRFGDANHNPREECAFHCVFIVEPCYLSIFYFLFIFRALAHFLVSTRTLAGARCLVCARFARLFVQCRRLSAALVLRAVAGKFGRTGDRRGGTRRQIGPMKSSLGSRWASE